MRWAAIAVCLRKNNYGGIKYVEKIKAIASGVLCAMTLTGCNYQVIDLSYEYDRAMISLPDGTVVEGEVQTWRDYEGDQLQVVIDGVTYLTHASRVVLIAE